MAKSADPDLTASYGQGSGSALFTRARVFFICLVWWQVGDGKKGRRLGGIRKEIIDNGVDPAVRTKSIHE